MKTPVTDKELMNDLIYASLMALFYAAIVGGYLLCLGITYGRLRERQAAVIAKPCSDCEEKAKAALVQKHLSDLDSQLEQVHASIRKPVKERGVEN